jgi:hypothetical protein
VQKEHEHLGKDKSNLPPEMQNPSKLFPIEEPVASGIASTKALKGRFQFGTQYSYVTRQTWSGVGPAGAGAPGVTPEGLDNLVFTSFRYYLP